MQMTRVIGLTGGIGSGKSTVAAIFRDLGAAVVDADQVARDVVTPGSPGLQAVVARFGADILTDDGALDRARLGALVFADPDARAALNAILHPRIAAESQRLIAAHAAGGAEVVLYEAALIVENQLHKGLAGLIVVSVSPQVQQRRLMERDHFDQDEADARIAAQLPLEDKVAVANWVIDNGGTLEQTRAQVENVWAEIAAKEAP